MLAAANAIENRSIRAGSERRPTGRRERDGGSPAVHIRGRRRGRAVDGLGSEVTRGSDDQPGRCELGFVDCPGQPEVDEDRSCFGQDDIARLDVPVDDTCAVHAGQSLRKPGRQPAQRSRPQRPVVCDGPIDRGSAHVPGHDVRRVAIDIRVDDLRDPRPTDPSECIDLPPEADPAVVSSDQPWT
jgi:hypothetical protein